MEYLVTFRNHMQAVAFARKLEKAGYRAVMMPRPRSLSASCGTAVRFSTRDNAAAICRGAEFESLYLVTTGGYRLILSGK